MKVNVQTLAENFSDYFDNKIANISRALEPIDELPSPTIPPDVTPLSCFMPIAEADMRKIILDGNSKTCAADPIPTMLLKTSIDPLLPALTNLVNSSITTSVVPDDLKLASITPRIKTNNSDVEDMKDYRPINNLPYVSKLIEKVIVKQLHEHLLTNNLYDAHQSAYRSHHSCETALVKITDDILRALDSDKCVLLVLLDQSAAFDTVHQDLLIHRLQARYGITEDALKWFVSYLKGRFQTVVIDGVHSSPKPLQRGFPQGSVLGPYMYPLYTSSLFEIAEKHRVSMHMYADDTQVYLACNKDTIDSAVDQLQGAIKDIKQWMADNHLKLNDAKTEFLVISKKTHKNTENIELKIGSATIKCENSAKNIGAILDGEMNMEAHIRNVVRVCYSHLRQIAHIRPCLTRKATEMIVNASITSRLDFVNSLLQGIPECLLRKLQNIQNNAAKLILQKRKFDHVTPLLKQLHWLPIELRIKFKINLLTFKALHGMAPAYLEMLVVEYQPMRSLRSSSQRLLTETRSKKKYGDRAFSVCAPKLWNALPQDLRTKDSLCDFKAALKISIFKFILLFIPATNPCVLN